MQMRAPGSRFFGQPRRCCPGDGGRPPKRGHRPRKALGGREATAMPGRWPEPITSTFQLYAKTSNGPHLYPSKRRAHRFSVLFTFTFSFIFFFFPNLGNHNRFPVELSLRTSMTTSPASSLSGLVGIRTSFAEVIQSRALQGTPVAARIDGGSHRCIRHRSRRSRCIQQQLTPARHLQPTRTHRAFAPELIAVSPVRRAVCRRNCSPHPRWPGAAAGHQHQGLRSATSSLSLSSRGIRRAAGD